jgi:lipopolysaccharide export LptBFGC system permease protein LptF
MFLKTITMSSLANILKTSAPELQLKMTLCTKLATFLEDKLRRMNSFLKFLKTIRIHRKESIIKMHQQTSLESRKNHSTVEDHKETRFRSKRNKRLSMINLTNLLEIQYKNLQSPKHSDKKKPSKKLEERYLTKAGPPPDRRKIKDIQLLKMYHRKITLAHC